LKIPSQASDQGMHAGIRLGKAKSDWQKKRVESEDSLPPVFGLIPPKKVSLIAPR
jgi:hypothetical protein